MPAPFQPLSPEQTRLFFIQFLTTDRPTHEVLAEFNVDPAALANWFNTPEARAAVEAVIGQNEARAMETAREHLETARRVLAELPPR